MNIFKLYKMITLIVKPENENEVLFMSKDIDALNDLLKNQTKAYQLKGFIRAYLGYRFENIEIKDYLSNNELREEYIIKNGDILRVIIGDRSSVEKIKFQRNPYIIFSTDMKKQITKENPHIVGIKLLKALKDLWNSLSDDDRQHYIDLWELEKPKQEINEVYSEVTHITFIVSVKGDDIDVMIMSKDIDTLNDLLKNPTAIYQFKTYISENLEKDIDSIIISNFLINGNLDDEYIIKNGDILRVRIGFTTFFIPFNRFNPYNIFLKERKIQISNSKDIWNNLSDSEHQRYIELSKENHQPPKKSDGEPLSPFLIYKYKMKSKILRDKPGIPPFKFEKIVFQMWKDLPNSEREKFVDMYEKEKISGKINRPPLFPNKSKLIGRKIESFSLEPFVPPDQEYKKLSNQTPFSSPYIHFATSIRHQVRNEYPNVSLRELVQIIRLMWESMSDEEKQHYVMLSESEKKSKIYDKKFIDEDL